MGQLNVEPPREMVDRNEPRSTDDIVWLLFIVARFSPPINEYHKQLILVAFGVFHPRRSADA
jgi:hypothetical protein